MKRTKRIFSAMLCVVLACPPVALKANVTEELGDGKYTRETADGDIASFGWEGDKHAPIAYRDGSYLLRDRDNLIVEFGIAGVAADDIQWYNKEGYLPCFVSEYSKNNMDFTVENFADKITTEPTLNEGEAYETSIFNPNEKYPAENGWTFGDVDYNGKRVQTFTAQADGRISDLQVLLVKWGEGEHDDLQAALYLAGEKGAPTGEALQQTTIAATDVQSGTYTQIPLDCSVKEGTRYALVLWQETLNPDAHYRWGYTYDPGKGDPYEDEYAGGMRLSDNSYHREDDIVGNNAMKVTVTEQEQTEGRDYEVAYSRLTVKNNNSSEQALPVVSEELIPLNEDAKSKTTIAAGETLVLDYAIAADRFGNTYFFPEDEVIAGFGGFDSHYEHMKTYWNNRLEGIIDIEKLPSGYEKLIDAYKAGYIYTFIVADGDELNVGENNYDRVFDHDCIGQLAALIIQGDYGKFKEYNKHVFDTPQYRDAEWKYSWPIALYLQKSGDIDFVREEFENIKKHVHTIESDREDNGTGIMKKSWGIDLYGHWLIDNWSALTGLTTYKYLCEKLGEEGEAQWAKAQYDSLIKVVTDKLGSTMEWYDFNYLPASVMQDNDGHRCDTPDDANWAAHMLFGRWAWEGYLFGADQEDSLMIDQIDATYTYGFQRLENIGFPAYTFGGFPGMCSAYNAGYGSSALRGELYRDTGIKAYMYMIENAQNGPYSWWEFIDGWDHHTSKYCGGSCQHMWGQSTASKVLVDSLISEKFDGSIIVGRGIPTEWIADGEEIVVSNAPISNNKRIGFTLSTSGKEVTLALTGDRGNAPLSLELMSFKDNIEAVQGGSFDEETGIVTVETGVNTVNVTLKEDGSSALYEAKKELTISAQKLQNEAKEKTYTKESVDVARSYAQKAIEAAASSEATLNQLNNLQEELNTAKAALKERGGDRMNFGYIPHTDAEISVDGKLDDAYKDALNVKIAKGANQEHYHSSELNAEAKFLWKDGELYVHVSVNDGNLVTSYKPEELANILGYMDCCELYLEAGAKGEFNKVMRFRVDVTGGVSVIDQNGIWETTPEGCAPYLDYAIVLDEEKNEYAVEFKVKQLLDPIEEGEEIGVFFRVIDKLNQGYGSQRSWYAECNRLGGPWQPEFYSKATIGTAAPADVKREKIDAACSKAEKVLQQTADQLSVSEKIAIETALAKAHNISKDIGSFQSDVDSAYDALMALLPVEEELPFVDVEEEAWYTDAVRLVYHQDIMTGKDETHFAPAEDLSRAEFATILYRMAGQPAVEYKPVFEDVKDGEFYTDAVLWANANGIITGYEGGSLFGTNDKLTREQMATMMFRYAKYQGADDLEVRESYEKFADSKEVSVFASEAMEWAVGTGMISGYADGRLAPQDYTNRAVCAAMIQRFLNR